MSTVLSNQMQVLYTRQKILELTWEQRSFDERRSILRLERQIVERDILQHEKNTDTIQFALNLARTRAATESILTAETATKKFSTAPPVLQAALKMNQDLANESVDIAARITALSNEKQSIEQSLDRYRQSFNSIKDKVSSAGLSETIGIRLRNAKNQLPDLSRIRNQIEQHRKEVDQAQLRRIELEDRSLELVDVNKEAGKVLSTITNLDSAKKVQIKQQLIQVLNEQKNKFLPDDLKAYDTYFENTLIPLIDSEKDYVKLVTDFKAYINERILWIKSSRVFTYKDMMQSVRSIGWLFDPKSWGRIIGNLIQFAIDNIFLTVLVCVLFATGFYAQKPVVNKIKQYGYYKTKLTLARFSDSLMSGILTLMVAAYWPLILWIVALVLTHHSGTDTFAFAIGKGLLATANILFFIILFIQLLRRSGLAESHFRWKADNITLIKHQLLWFGPFILPFVFILQTTNNQPIQSHFDSLGRLAFIAITIFTSILLYRLLNPAKGIFKDTLIQNPESWLNRTRFIWLFIVLSAPLALAVTAISGYLYTATALMTLLVDSFWVVLAAIITRGFFIRWLNIAHRKLVIEQIRKKITVQEEQENVENVSTPAESPATGSEELDVDVSQISKQTQKLLNNITGFAIIIGLYLIWADILPALNILDNITLWQSKETVANGQIVLTTITLGNGLLALAILLITALVGVNIPGLLEIAILQRLPFTPSARYGITTIARYFIMILGIILSFNAIGIGWAKIQWLAAAITVGLGFGLQEIFANLVSGIIILIERQIRVGDFVTVGTTSGQVSRVKMRATTIVDWDKKELIIPNKEFVTGQVVNWTLSDTIIRLVIPVGIAYGSDTKKAHALLLKIARENKNVLKDPAPEALFIAFGDSSLDFELRVFLAHSNLRLQVQHDLLMQIDQAFRKADIEIAFPQRDIHIRSMVSSTVMPENKQQ